MIPLWKILGWEREGIICVPGYGHVYAGGLVDARFVTEPHLLDWLAEHSQAVGVWLEAGPEACWVVECSVSGAHHCETNPDRRTAIESVVRRLHEAIEVQP